MSEAVRLSQRMRSPFRAISGALAKGREREETVPALTPASYRTFSSKIAPALTGIGGGLALAGGLGTWIRAERLEDEFLGPERVATVMGYAEASGGVIAALGSLALVGALLWLAPRLWPKVLPALSGLAAASVIVWQLLALVDRSEAMAEEVRQTSELEFTSFHASLGWGAWTMLVAALLLGFGVGAGILREIDRRRGIAE